MAKNTKAGRLFCSNFLKQSVTEIKMWQKFSAYRGRRSTYKKDMTFSSVLNYTKIFLFLVNKVIQNIFLHTKKMLFSLQALDPIPTPVLCTVLSRIY